MVIFVRRSPVKPWIDRFLCYGPAEHLSLMEDGQLHVSINIGLVGVLDATQAGWLESPHMLFLALYVPTYLLGAFGLNSH